VAATVQLLLGEGGEGGDERVSVLVMYLKALTPMPPYTKGPRLCPIH